MTPQTGTGIITTKSAHSVEETVAKLERALQQKGVKLFAAIDHSGEAQSAGFSMRPTKLLIFGNPKAGTPVMLAVPTAAIDLPVKILIWENEAGETLVSYNSTEYLRRRHEIPSELIPNISAVETLAAMLAG